MHYIPVRCPGGDIHYRGSYEITDGAVTIELDGGPSTPVFSLEDGGEALATDDVVLERVNVEPDTCSDRPG